MQQRTIDILNSLDPVSMLHVGAGDTPWKVATCILDKYGPGQNQERGGELRVPSGAQFIQASAEKMPIPDNSFDFVLAVHVAEHVEDPVAFCSEIQRVGRAGLFENPTPFYELIFGHKHHRWLTWVDHGGRMCFAPRPHGFPFGNLFHSIAAQNRSLGHHVMHANNNAWFDVFQWTGGFDFKIYDTPPSRIALDWNLSRSVPIWD